MRDTGVAALDTAALTTNDGGKTPVRSKRSMVRLGLVGAAAVVLPVMWSGQAFADYQPQPGDIVGVGGDTPQFAVDFALNGYPGGGAGYNSSATVNRVTYFDATSDANARNAYANGSTEASPIPLNPTDVLRANTYPVQRVQSSGTAIKALLADWEATPSTAHKQASTYVNEINFVASASLPSSAQQTQAVNQGWGGLHVTQIATDNIEIAVDSASTNAPVAGLSIEQLLYIYETTGAQWSTVPGITGGSTDTIIPELPPAGSSVYKTFIKALNTAYNGSSGTTPAFTLSHNVVTVEQNAPTGVTGAATPADALVPFAAGRLALWNKSYFHNPATVFPGGSALAANVSLLTGTDAGDGNPVYKSAISDYIVFRQSDLSDATPIEPGGTQNWAEALFSNSSGPPAVFSRASTQTLLADAGVTPAYDDLGT
jgi:hypothetical protein